MFETWILEPLINNINKFGEKEAFLINEKHFTYHEFAKNVSKIRFELKEAPISVKNIGLVVNDDIETYASIFAIWLEGLAYVPLHPLQPVDRSVEIIAQADISFVLNSDDRIILPNTQVINTSKLKFTDTFLDINPVHENDLAYILFTSGSTGKPKGVQITRKNIGAFMKSFWETGILITEHDRCLQCFDLTFDVSVQSFLVPLTKGACTYTIPHDQIKYSYVYGLLEEHQLTFGAMAPSLVRFLRPYFDEINIPSMRYCIMTAEASPVDLIDKWAQCIPNAEIFDFYGPTEATIYCTCYTYKRDGGNKQLNGMLSIGRPMPGLKAIIIDEHQKCLGLNMKGELCISGDQVTPGYWKNSEKNKDSFITLELDGVSTRFYKTGDSCYFDVEWDIILAGRLDHQVKIQGYRIELGEIEYHAREFLKGHNAVAVDFNNHLGITEIALFVEGIFSNESGLISYLNSKIPYYMVPAKIFIESAFPINTSGKVDRIKLKNLLSRQS